MMKRDDLLCLLLCVLDPDFHTVLGLEFPDERRIP
jgi:hypothetical protein